MNGPTPTPPSELHVNGRYHMAGNRRRRIIVAVATLILGFAAVLWVAERAPAAEQRSEPSLMFWKSGNNVQRTKAVLFHRSGGIEHQIPTKC